jgi:Fe-Mn family superoxide dismutase
MRLITRRSMMAGVAAGSALALLVPASAQTPSGPFKLEPLSYPPNKNEPHIDAQTMEIHHGRHHAAFVNNLNTTVAQYPELGSRPLHEVLGKLTDVPETVRTTIRNSGGGHANHTMFWQIMGGAGGEPTGDLRSAIVRDFGALDKLQEQFNAAGLRVFGSGWVFVTVSTDGKLALTTKPNQDTPLIDGQRVLIGNDVWEHAYYLKYQNRRADYLKAWWNVLDWDRIAARYARAKAGTLTV